MESISKYFGSVQALKDAYIDLYSGEVHALMGENGAGKSTLMNILCGALKHYTGDIYINGEITHLKSPLHASKVGISKIHQELQLMPYMTVAENIFMGREIKSKAGIVNHKEMNDKAAFYLDMLELNVKPTDLIKDLRVGEQQLVEIAKAISMNSRILIMDEPTSAISKSDSEKLFKVIERLKSEGVGIIYITHRMEEIFRISDRVTVMRDGNYIGTMDVKEASRDQIIKMMVDRTIEELYPERNHLSGDEVLRVENLTFRPSEYSFSRSLDKISLEVHKGEVLGIAGLMGSGRSEFLECIFGMHHSRINGNIYLNGKKVDFKAPKQAIESGIAFATEDRKGTGLVLLRSIGENMSMPLLKLFSTFGLMNEKKEQAEWSKQMTGLRIKAPSYKTLTSNLSGGNQQKVVLGRCLMIKPKLLLLDEPTRGIDVGAKQEVYNLINRLAEQGMAIIVVSSELPEIIGMSDRIVTFCEGRLTGVFNKEDATQEKLLDVATLN